MNKWSLALVCCIACAGIAALAVTASNIRPKDHRNVSFDTDRDGRYIIFSAADSELYWLDVERSKVRRLNTPPEIAVTSPSFSPDGSQVMCSGRTGPEIGSALYLLTKEGKVIRQLTDGLCWDVLPAFSADGKTIVFARGNRHRPYSMGGWTWDHFDVYTVGTDGQNLQRLTQEEFYGMTAPAFWDKDDSVLFTADAQGLQNKTKLYSVSTGGGQPVPVAGFKPPAGWKGGAIVSELHKARSSERVTFVSDRARPYSYDIYVREKADEGTIKPVGVLSAGSYNKRPRLVANGRKIFFLSENPRESSNSLWQVDSDGKNLHQVADNSLFASPLEWKPK